MQNQSFARAQEGGRAQVDRFRRWMDARGVQYASDFFVYGLTTGALAPAATAIRRINIDHDSAFEWLEATGGVQTTTTGAGSGYTTPCNVSVQIIDSVSARNLMNQPVPMQNFVGSGEKPFVLPIPRRFMSSTQLTVVFTNYDTAVTYSSVNLQLVGRKLFNAAIPGMYAPPLQRFNQWQDEFSGRVLSEDLFMYDTALASLALASNQKVTTLVEGDSDFEWILANLSGGLDVTASYLAGAGLNLTLQIKSGDSGRELFSQAQPASSVTGTGTFSFVLQQPRMFTATTPIEITFFNNDTAVALKNLHLTMIGRKIFEGD